MAGRKYPDPIDRFMEAVFKDDKTGCWLWTKTKNHGYGYFRVKGKLVRASRWAYQYFNKIEINSRWLFVCHKCDVRNCVNPDHLFLGTPQENSDDSKKKGRHLYGTKHKDARLTEKEVKKIRLLKSNGRTLRSLAKEFGVTHQSIYQIVHKEIWKHVL